MSRKGAQLVLSWPLTAAEFLLETGDRLSAGVSWTPLTNDVVVVDERYVLATNISARAAFYRLHKP